jgi:serine/threonine-protein kinase HipA
MLIREAFIFLPIKGQDMAVATIQHHRDGSEDQFVFVYGDRYLSHPDAYSIDPRQLPLRKGVFNFPSLPLSIQDNGPDDFGRYLYQQLHGDSPASELDYHLGSGMRGIGAMAFSPTTEPPKQGELSVSLSSLDELYSAYRALEQHKSLPEKMEKLLTPGISIAGARPKALLEEEGEEWIVKFNRDNDVFNIAIAEHTTMEAAGSAGIRVAQSRIAHIGEDTVYLTKRFDREHGTRLHYLSAHTLMGANQARSKNLYAEFSYPALSKLTSVVSESPKADCQELFRRMVFNVMCGNRDDHLKNTGFIKAGRGDYYRLSLCFDVVPAATGNTHAIGLGDYGPIGNIENAMSQYHQFNLSEGEAKDIVEEVSQAVSTIPSRAADCGMHEKEVGYIKDKLTLV